MDMNILHIASTYGNRHSIYSLKNPRHQNFSFRSPFIKYILKNSTGKLWKKFIKTCKYFYATNPIYPVQRLIVGDIFDAAFNADREGFDRNKLFPKLWLYDTFNCHKSFSASKLISKIVKSDLRILYISGQALTLEQYQVLASSEYLKELNLNQCLVKDSQNNKVTFDKLLENLQQVEHFCFDFQPESKYFEKDTVNKMGKILSGFKSMYYFCLSNLNETFEFSSLMDFISKNEKIHVSLQYDNILQFSDAYKEMVETFSGKLVSNPPKKPPYFFIPKFDGAKYREYYKMYLRLIARR